MTEGMAFRLIRITTLLAATGGMLCELFDPKCTWFVPAAVATVSVAMVVDASDGVQKRLDRHAGKTRPPATAAVNRDAGGSDAPRFGPVPSRHDGITVVLPASSFHEE